MCKMSDSCEGFRVKQSLRTKPGRANRMVLAEIIRDPPQPQAAQEPGGWESLVGLKALKPNAFTSPVSVTARSYASSVHPVCTICGGDLE